MNAKEELLKELKVGLTIRCARITFGRSYLDDDEIEVIRLKIGYTASDYDQFMALLDRQYDNSWGGQELFGVVWLEDGMWLERGEYDGSEWWEHKVCPVIPDELLE